MNASSNNSSNDFNNIKLILHELEQLYNRDDDIKDILDIIKMKKEIDYYSDAQLKDAKEIIKVMTSKITKKEEEIKAPSQAEHSQSLKNLSNKENITQQCEAISKIIDNKRNNINKLASTTLQLKERANEFNDNITLTDSRTAYAISLYAKISNITWNYKATAGKLSGCIGNDTTKEVHNFELDTRASTSFEVANNLWDLIGESLPQHV